MFVFTNSVTLFLHRLCHYYLLQNEFNIVFPCLGNQTQGDLIDFNILLFFAKCVFDEIEGQID
jgi:hypothetical protein